MMPTPSFITSHQSQELWKAPAPLWLWDVDKRRIAWANQACLDFSGAQLSEDLIRLKFSPELPFVKQLAALWEDNEEAGRSEIRQLIRFPVAGGDFIFDCLCKSVQIEPACAGVLVELLADKGKVATPKKCKSTKSTKNGILKDPLSVAEKPAELASASAQEKDVRDKNAPQVLDLEIGQHVNGFEVEPDKVAEDDLLTLQEIARMINGPGSLGLGQGSAGASPDGRPAVATRNKSKEHPSQVAEDKGDVSSKGPGGQLKNGLSDPDQNEGVSVADKTPRASVMQQSGLATSERNYFLESLPAALAIAMGGRLMRANEAFLYAFGYGSESELRKAGGLAVLFPHSEEGVLKSDRAINDPGQSMQKYARSGQTTTLGVSRSGRKRQIPISFRNVSTGREPVQILILHEDALHHENDLSLSQQIWSNERLENSANKNVGQESIDFLATVSHEVRTPLNSIIGFSELMKDEQFGAVDVSRFREYAGDIHDSAMHALSLINDLLDITKIMAGKPDLDFEAVDANEIISAAMRSMRAQAERKKITLQTSLADGLPGLYADKRSMKQIFLNLVSNAIKFTSPGGRLVVSSGIGKDDGVLLSVVDTGIGMRKDQINTALEPFAQLDTVRNRTSDGLSDPEKGTGLGLPLTKALVKAHNASFVIDSTPGQGTRVEIFFPNDQLVR